MGRDEFSAATKRDLAARAGHICSICKAPTAGPTEQATGTVNVGDAAHITAAAPGGSRYDPSLTPDQRSSIDNAIWLCNIHARIIDRDEDSYSVEALRLLKQEAEMAAAKALGRPPTKTTINAAVVLGSNAICISGPNAVYLGPNAIKIVGPTIHKDE